MAPLWCHSSGKGKPAHGDGGERHRASAALLLAVFASLYVLFLPTYGPLLDHHFVEKAPNHVHVYLGQSGPEHTHPFEAQHDHYHVVRTLSANSAGRSEIYDGVDKIAFLAPYEGTGQSAAAAILFVAPASIVFQHPGDMFRFGLTGDDTRLLAAVVGPLRRPPRA